ncbi:hypothetical protein JXL83_07835 [candidate division WOR-3 bacterium]|nr:hypothetical protein [candidate division WOR-3 bacterium]
MLAALYFFPALFFYGVVKGVIIKKNIWAGLALNAVTAILFVLLFMASLKFNIAALIIIQFYLSASALEYVLLNFGLEPNSRIFDSYVFVKSKHAVIRYSVFKPFLLMAADIYLFVKKAPLLGIKDDLNFSLVSKKDVVVNIRF